MLQIHLNHSVIIEL